MRNPNGYGSVYKLSGKRRKPFAAKKTVGFNENGYPISTVIGYYEKRKDALEALALFNATGKDAANYNATVADIYKIFQQRKEGKVSKSAIDVYAAAYKHIAELHNAQINAVRTGDMQTIISNLNRGWQTKSHISTLLVQLFDIAIELDVCDKNYAKFITLESKPKSEIHKPFTEEEIQKLFDNISTPYVDTVLIMIYSGMRPSEMLKIEQGNIDLENRIMVGGIKTRAGKDRRIPINKKIVPLIQKKNERRKNAHQNVISSLSRTL